MPSKRHSIGSTVGLAIFVAALVVTGTRAAAQSETVLHNFSGKDGASPHAGLVIDAAGNLYGTTFYGGTGVCASRSPSGCGTVFELTPNGNGGWTEKVLHSFNDNGKDGYYPYAGLVIDAVGNLYGTTGYGGAGVCRSGNVSGCGTVFELTPSSGGGWAEKVPYSFGGGADGENPQGGVILDAASNLYGTTYGNLESCTHAPYKDCGTVFELTPHAGGTWSEKVLHSFSDNGTDGYAPYGSLVQDAAGNLFGGTYWGGTYYDGTAFELTPGQGGSWTESVYSFYWGKGINGGGPGGLILDAAGNLYGTGALGGTSYSGEVFELSPAAGGSWTQTTLYNFDIYTTGAQPNASLMFDSAGNLYGTNVYGGAGTAICFWFGGGNESASCGTVFELSSAGGGNWTQTTLHSFGTGSDGQIPYAGLIRDASGKLYGTTVWGGSFGGGTVFEITP